MGGDIGEDDAWRRQARNHFKFSLHEKLSRYFRATPPLLAAALELDAYFILF